jgi:hypothetical protein
MSTPHDMRYAVRKYHDITGADLNGLVVLDLDRAAAFDQDMKRRHAVR